MDERWRDLIEGDGSCTIAWMHETTTWVDSWRGVCLQPLPTASLIGLTLHRWKDFIVDTRTPGSNIAICRKVLSMMDHGELSVRVLSFGRTRDIHLTQTTPRYSDLNLFRYHDIALDNTPSHPQTQR